MKRQFDPAAVAGAHEGDLGRLLAQPWRGGPPPVDRPAEADAALPNPGRRRFLGGAALAGLIGGGLALRELTKPAPLPTTDAAIRPYLSPAARAALDNHQTSTLMQFRDANYLRVMPVVYVNATVYTPDHTGLLPEPFVREWARMLNRFADAGWVGSLAGFGSVQLADAGNVEMDGIRKADFLAGLPWDRRAEFERLRRAVFSFIFFHPDSEVAHVRDDREIMLVPETMDRHFGMRDAHFLMEGSLMQNGLDPEKFEALQ